MAFATAKCRLCGADLADTKTPLCPACALKMASRLRLNPWLIAIIQIAMSTIFMLVFHFPRIMIMIFAGMILSVTALSAHLKNRPPQPSRAQKPLSHPVRFRILSIGVAIFSLAFLVSLVFGTAIFMDSWMRWSRYDGAAFHASDFVVTQTYFQKQRRGGRDVYASGTVEGNKEWMSLVPYLQSVPNSQAELDSLVPAGTSIPVYIFPGLKGRARVQVYRDVSPAEANRRTAVDALKYGLGGLALSAGMIFILIRLRRDCFAPDPANESMTMAAGR